MQAPRQHSLLSYVERKTSYLKNCERGYNFCACRHMSGLNVLMRHRRAEVNISRFISSWKWVFLQASRQNSFLSYVKRKISYLKNCEHGNHFCACHHMSGLNSLTRHPMAEPYISKLLNSKELWVILAPSGIHLLDRVRVWWELLKNSDREIHVCACRSHKVVERLDPSSWAEPYISIFLNPKEVWVVLPPSVRVLWELLKNSDREVRFRSCRPY